MFSLLVVFTVEVSAEVCKGSKVKAALLKRYDRAIFLSADDLQDSADTHLAFGKPSCGRLLFQKESVVCYDRDRRVAVWATYRLRKSDVKHAERLDSFRTDPRLSEVQTATSDDYKGSNWDRGHVVPRDDLNRTKSAQAYSFYLSNMTPQSPLLNQGMWAWLVQAVREWAVEHGEVYVVSGAVFEDQERTVPSGNVSIPSGYFKIILRREGTQIRAMAFSIENKRTGLPLPPRESPIGAEADRGRRGQCPQEFAHERFGRRGGRAPGSAPGPHHDAEDGDQRTGRGTVAAHEATPLVDCRRGGIQDSRPRA